VTDDRRLPVNIRAIIEDVRNEICFSAVSALEIVIKAQSQRIAFVGNPRSFVADQLTANTFRQLPIDVRHALRVFSLPLIHRDPFDRMLIAQAIEEDLMLLSHDAVIKEYDVSVIW
jgi:PIN domain nuclease of toxin-antitoxin system